MKRVSLKKRTVRMFIGMIIMLTFPMGVFYIFELRNSYIQARHNALRAIVAGTTIALYSSDDAKTVKSEIGMLIQASQSPGDIAYRIWFDSSSSDLVVSSAPGTLSWDHLHKPPFKEPPASGSELLKEDAYEDEGEEFHVIWSRQPTPYGVANILVEHSNRASLVRGIWMSIRFIVLLTLISLAAVGASILLISYAMSPIDATAKLFEGIDQGNLGRIELKDEKRPIELDPFVQALNRMLGRLKAAMTRQRQFTADASHELRTPLATAKSSLQLAVSKERTAEEYKEAIGVALANLGRMEQLSDQLLNLARLDAGADRESFASVDLGEIVIDAVGAVKAQPETTYANIVHGDFSPCLVDGVRDKLIRLFQNIIENAAKYGPDGEPIIITLEKRDGSAIVRIKDNGGDIPPEVLPRLFDRFFRIDKSRSRSSGGAGLGLAIAKEIAEMHRGNIDIISSKETGTVVTIKMPCLPDNFGNSDRS